MALIMRNKKKEEGDKRKQLYTWVGCGLVIVLTLVAIVPNLGGENKPDYSKFANSRMADLASLPFGSDAAAANFLNNNPEYQDASNADLLGSLFSSDDRKERQASDKANGAPPPPDPEYKAIADQNKLMEKNKKVAEKRVEKQKKANKEYADAKKKNSTRQSNGGKTLQGGRGSSGGGASSGVTGSIWGYQGKNINGMPSAHTATAQDYASAKKYGRNVGVYQAGIESAKGANAKDGEGAAAGAIDAFQKDIAAEELEKDKEETGLDVLPEGVSSDLRDDLAHDLSDDLDNGDDGGDDTDPPPDDYTIGDNCIDSRGEIVMKCVGMKLVEGLINIGSQYLSWGLQGGWSDNKDKKIIRSYCKTNPKQCAEWKLGGNNNGIYTENGHQYYRGKCLDC